MDGWQTLLLGLPVLVLSVVVHEAAHAWMAARQGDPTAALLGRLTLNPLPHLDPIGSVLVPALLLLGGAPFLFGWAKPVPVDPCRYRHYRRGDILVSLAGVGANLLLALLFALLLAALVWANRWAPGFDVSVALLMGMARVGILVNCALVVFNLLPVPPLDGSHVVAHLLPPRAAWAYRRFGAYGLIVLLLLTAVGLTGWLGVPVRWLTKGALGLVRLLT